MPDILEETPVAISKVPDECPGKRIHAATVWRWRIHGVRGFRLESYVVGGKVFTSKEAIRRFILATTAARNGVPAETIPSRRRQAEIAAAERELDAGV